MEIIIDHLLYNKWIESSNYPNINFVINDKIVLQVTMILQNIK